MLMFYLRTKLRTRSYSDALVITIKPRAKDSFCAVTLLFVYIQQKILNKNSAFF
jgi:hypothetical protein